MFRRLAVAAASAVAVVLVPAPALAHGLELARDDAPIPIEIFLIGGIAVVAVSFAAVSLGWRQPRLQDGPRTASTQSIIGERAYAVARWAGLIGLVAVVVTGFGAGDIGVGGLSPIIVWIGFWLIVPFVSVLVGDLWTPVNPWRRIGEILRLGEHERPELLERWGVYPAAALFTIFVWFEMVYPDAASGSSLARAALIYTVVMAAMMAAAGRETGLQIADAFTTYNRAVSSLSPRGRTGSGRFVARGWLRALPVLPRWRGLPLFVVVMIAAVSFDSLDGTLWWRDLLASFGVNSAETWVGTLGLLGMIALVGSGYWLACVLAALAADDSRYSAGTVASSFAHSLIPIAVAYAIAHYFTLVLFEGQLMLIAASDPFGRGWDLLGTATWRVTVWLGDGVVWWIQVLVILGGHVIAVVLAHDRALAEFPAGKATRTQYAMVLIMIVLTMLGLSLLAAG